MVANLAVSETYQAILTPPIFRLTSCYLPALTSSWRAPSTGGLARRTRAAPPSLPRRPAPPPLGSPPLRPWYARLSVPGHRPTALIGALRSRSVLQSGPGRLRFSGTSRERRSRAISGPACCVRRSARARRALRSEEHTSELQSLRHLVCRLLLEKK